MEKCGKRGELGAGLADEGGRSGEFAAPAKGTTKIRSGRLGGRAKKNAGRGKRKVAKRARKGVEQLARRERCAE